MEVITVLWEAHENADTVHIFSEDIKKCNIKKTY